MDDDRLKAVCTESLIHLSVNTRENWNGVTPAGLTNALSKSRRIVHLRLLGFHKVGISDLDKALTSRPSPIATQLDHLHVEGLGRPTAVLLFPTLLPRKCCLKLLNCPGLTSGHMQLSGLPPRSQVHLFGSLEGSPLEDS